MALTPDPTETFVREVDENLRRDQMRDIAKTYGAWIVAGAVLFLAAAGGWLYWQDRQMKAAQAQSEQLHQIYKDIGAGQTAAAPERLAALEESHGDAMRATAKFVQAAVALEAGNRKQALAKYAEAAADDSLPKAYRDLALIRQTALEFDSLKPEAVVARLEPLAKAGQPWFGSAGELTAMALLKQDKTQEAGRLFAAIAADEQVPQTIRSRAVQIAGTLGVDASASLPLTVPLNQ